LKLRIRRGLSSKFLILISLIITTVLSPAFYWIARDHEQQLLAQVKEQARLLFQQIVLERKWIAKHGGVYVIKRPGITSNPFLQNPDLKIGRITLTKRNPAFVTRELANYAAQEGTYWFHITSLKLINPDNAPDAIEKYALDMFARGKIKELVRKERLNGRRVLRYIAPLYIEEPCLECHAFQGYRLGDVRGAISIFLPMDKVYQAIRGSQIKMALTGIVTIAAVSVALFLLCSFLVIRPLRKIKTDTEALRHGQLESPVPLETGDELEDLSKAFCSMAHQLKEYHAQLEERVRSATANLRETNQRLLEANEKLRELHQKKSDFIANVSHELRTPLTAIRGALDYLISQADEKTLSFIELVKKNVDRLIRMVNNLLDLTRIELGKAELRILPHDLSFLINEAIAICAPLAERKGIKIKADLPDSLVLQLDEDRIKQVLINLISNAIEYSEENSLIQLNARLQDGFAKVEVIDQGIGIHPADQERIFEKFQKGRNAAGQGAGLGLTICKTIIEAHGGRIWVESRPERGSRFCFLLPRKDSSGERDARPDTHNR